MQVIPAILTSDVAKGRKTLTQVRDITDWVHIDVMDGTWIPSTTVTLDELSNDFADFSTEVHLMVGDPESYLGQCEQYHIERVYAHIETISDMEEFLEHAAAFSGEVGIALHPMTNPDVLKPFVSRIDAVLIMTVEPGAQGGEFLPEMLEKVEMVRQLRSDIWIAVDGGVNLDTIDEVRTSGVNAAGVGSAIASADDPGEAFEELSQ